VISAVALHARNEASETAAREGEREIDMPVRHAKGCFLGRNVCGEGFGQE
jgi:hypothetical protein